DNLDLLDKDASLVIYTPAIPKEHKQFNWYKDNDYRVLKRSQVLGEISKDKFCIAVAGSHGKTTVSSMIAHIVNETKGCTAFLGGIATNFGTNYIHSGKEIMVVEADEFDRSFMTLHPNIAVVTSIDSDHLDIYGSLENIQAEFHAFTNLLDEKGALIAKKDLTVHGNHTGAKSMSYDIEADANIKAINYKIIDGTYHFDIDFDGEIVEGLELSLGGKHNVENAIAAIVVAIELGIEKEEIKKALASFKGIYRRFEKRVDGDTVYIDDYAHHPNEVKALLNSVKELYPNQKITCIFQPHLFSRTKDLAIDFGTQLSIADEVILLPIYPARELPIEGVTSDLILQEIKHSQKSIKTREEVLDYVKDINHGVILTVGAGDIDRLVPGIEKIIKANG
ncbi:MAG: UDP-N-acetylmuramate--L-alanine ligase, partial [Chitinophagales bacterium]